MYRAIDRQRLLSYVVLIFVAVCTHGLLLLNDGVFWDDWLYLMHLYNGHWDIMKYMSIGKGLYVNYFYFQLLNILPKHPLVYKSITFLCIITIAIIIYEICQKTKWIGRTEGLLIAILTMVYPGFQAWDVMLMSKNVLYYTFFLMACLFCLKFETAKGGRRLFLRICALLFFGVSFHLRSVLPVYYGMLLLQFIYYCQIRGGINRKHILRFSVNRLDFLVFPVVGFLGIRLLTPSDGGYIYYYSFKLDRLWAAWATYPKYGVFFQIRASIKLLSEQRLVVWMLVVSSAIFIGWPIMSWLFGRWPSFGRRVKGLMDASSRLVQQLWAILLLAAIVFHSLKPSLLWGKLLFLCAVMIILIFVFNKHNKVWTIVVNHSRFLKAAQAMDKVFCGSINPVIILFCGVMFWLLGTFPYAVIGQHLAWIGWYTKDALLMGLPMALIIIALVRQGFTRSNGSFSRLGWVVLVVFLLSFGGYTCWIHLDWLARWVKDRSIIVNLAGLNEKDKNYSIYIVEDHYPLGGQTTHASYEWTTIFKKAFGDEKRFVTDVQYIATLPANLRNWHKSYKTEFKRREYHVSEVDPFGCQATFAIFKGLPGYTRRDLVAKYLYYKFIRPDKMRVFLTRVTKLKIFPRPSPVALNCE